ncbi:unnamed protein product [Macrosiphum euphorbiae]|uniref:Uncharacterized protein n=1 Tax=Macrosiphum euphorbiae TaxID=13131 RepID=A0AAV0X267_9HEMI|nr:unnamed protein product [Macrosiphum euphorbiae]
MSFITVDRLLVLLDNPILRKKLLEKKRVGVHPIDRRRKIYGEFHHLFFDLKKSPTRFFEYLRMSIETYDFILTKICHRIRKKTTNFKKPISPAERLYVTIR